MKTVQQVTQTENINTEVLVATVATAAVLAKVAKKTASDAFTRAEADAIATLIGAGIDTVTLVDGTKVTLKGGTTGETSRSIDAEVLADRLTASVLDKVTKRVVDLPAFDAAVKSGLIDSKVVSAVTVNAPRKASLVITTPVTARR